MTLTDSSSSLRCCASTGTLLRVHRAPQCAAKQDGHDASAVAAVAVPSLAAFLPVAAEAADRLIALAYGLEPPFALPLGVAADVVDLQAPVVCVGDVVELMPVDPSDLLLSSLTFAPVDATCPRRRVGVDVSYLASRHGLCIGTQVRVDFGTGDTSVGVVEGVTLDADNDFESIASGCPQLVLSSANGAGLRFVSIGGPADVARADAIAAKTIGTSRPEPVLTLRVAALPHPTLRAAPSCIASPPRGSLIHALLSHSTVPERILAGGAADATWCSLIVPTLVAPRSVAGSATAALPTSPLIGCADGDGDESEWRLSHAVNPCAPVGANGNLPPSATGRRIPMEMFAGPAGTVLAPQYRDRRVGDLCVVLPSPEAAKRAGGRPHHPRVVELLGVAVQSRQPPWAVCGSCCRLAVRAMDPTSTSSSSPAAGVELLSPGDVLVVFDRPAGTRGDSDERLVEEGGRTAAPGSPSRLRHQIALTRESPPPSSADSVAPPLRHQEHTPSGGQPGVVTAVLSDALWPSHALRLAPARTFADARQRHHHQRGEDGADCAGRLIPWVHGKPPGARPQRSSHTYPAESVPWRMDAARLWRPPPDIHELCADALVALGGFISTDADVALFELGRHFSTEAPVVVPTDDLSALFNVPAVGCGAAAAGGVRRCHVVDHPSVPPLPNRGPPGRQCIGVVLSPAARSRVSLEVVDPSDAAGTFLVPMTSGLAVAQAVLMGMAGGGADDDTVAERVVTATARLAAGAQAGRPGTRSFSTAAIEAILHGGVDADADVAAIIVDDAAAPAHIVGQVRYVAAVLGVPVCTPSSFLALNDPQSVPPPAVSGAQLTSTECRLAAARLAVLRGGLAVIRPRAPEDRQRAATVGARILLNSW